MSIETAVPSGLAADLRRACGGALYLPGDPGYDAARRAWNLNVEQAPAAVAYPADAGEVAALVRTAAAGGLRVAPQGSGHNARPLPHLGDTVLLRTAAMNHLGIDPVQMRASVGAGVLWGETVAAVAGVGLAALHCTSPEVGVIGYSIGGGIGWYARRHGLQANALTAAEIVVASGEVLRVDGDHELLWALRGGGGSYGIVTMLEFRLLPVTEVYAGWLAWDLALAPAVLARWADWCAEAPETVTTALRFLRTPDRQLVVVDGAVLGDESAAAALLAPLRELRPSLDTFAPTAPAALATLHQDPQGPTASVSGSTMLTGLPAAAQAALLDAAGPDSGSSLIVTELRQLGGALARPTARGGPLPSMPDPFTLLGFASGASSELAARGRIDADRLIDAAGPWASAWHYLNLAEHSVDTRTAFDADVFARLQAVRATYDPDGLVVANHQVPLP